MIKSNITSNNCSSENLSDEYDAAQKVNEQSNHLERKITNLEIYKDPIDRMFVCSLCSTRYFLKKQIRMHAHYHRKEYPNLIFNIISRDEDEFLCDKCGIGFVSKLALEHHLYQNCPRTCEVCHKSFTQKKSLKTHYRMMHSKYKPYQCGFCVESFPNKFYLKTHMKNHVKQKSCEESFEIKHSESTYFHIDEIDTFITINEEPDFSI